jgi:hypothetical protein
VNRDAEVSRAGRARRALQVHDLEMMTRTNL